MRAEGSLTAIFQAPAAVSFNLPAPQTEADGLSAEFISLAPRPDGIPFLSDDRRLLQLLAGALAVVLENVRFRVERRRQEEREQQLRWLASRAELKALRAQINPHFLFNSLSVIAGLVHYQPEKADEAIEQLAQVFRYTLRKSEHEWAPLCEEIDFVTAYLRIEQARFGDRLQVAFEVDPAAAHLAIPAMSIQPLVENAIKHGVAAVEGPGAVGLRAALDDGHLRLEVSDSGPGFPPGFSLENGGEGHGLRNVMERLRGYYGDAARLSWENQAVGTRVVLVLPAGEQARDARSDRG
jgi:LytS/YehU family sensor histidine kinase